MTQAGWIGRDRSRAAARLFTIVKGGTRSESSSSWGRRPVLDRGSLPADLRRRIEHVVEWHHRAAERLQHGERVFVLPSWLTASEEGRTGNSTLRVHLQPQPERPVVVKGNMSSCELQAVVLSPRKPGRWRRRRIVAWARSLLQDLEVLLGAPPSHARWLLDMLDADSAERAGIELWETFLDAADMPRGLRIPGFEASLSDLVTVSSGRDRRWFANQWPAAAAVLLRSGKAVPAFARVECNRAAAVSVATTVYCCQGNDDCGPAGRFARRDPRYRENMMFARVMGGHEMGRDLGIPILVVHANDDDGGELQRRMARHPAHAREQVALAVATARQPAFRTDTCRVIAAKLIANILAGSDFDPNALDPGAIADAFYAISADCLAAFVATRLAAPGQASFCQLPDAGADSLETGVLALLTHLTRDRRLRPVQFARMVRHAAAHGVHHVESNDYPNDARSWLPSPGWRSDTDTRISGAIVTPLLNVEEIRAEGRAMTNCLRSGSFDMRVSLGELALFSVKAGKHRATLSIRSEQRTSMHRIDSYSIAAIRGPRNERPARVCEDAAGVLVERLNARAPFALPGDVILRRDQSANRRSFNVDLSVANERWRRLYIGCFPRRFRSRTPAGIVDDVMRGPDSRPPRVAP